MQMNEFFSASSFFGLALTLVVFFLMNAFCNKVRVPFINPVILSLFIIIAVLIVFDISYSTYEKSAGILNTMLTPATICLAIPLYRQINVLKKNFSAIIIGVSCGAASSVVTVFILSKVFNVSDALMYSMLPKSVTSAIALGISGELGGILAITTLCVTITGQFGAIIAVSLLRILKITDPAAKGLAIGTSCHAMGTTRAMQIGEIEGAMSSLAIVVSGITTMIIISIVTNVI
ncbi:MAG: LrgB family protein [Lachnospiraceae bacterium]|nr:LrgB family protein [Lachnospiraceae bacterium]